MKIGIDCRTILNPGAGEQAGVGHYTYYLVKSLLALNQDNIYVLFFDDRFKNKKEFSAYNNVIIRTFPFYQYKKYLPVTYSQMLVSALLGREKLDVFHSPANTLPLPYDGKSVVTVHDLAIYKYPEFFPGKFLNRQIFSTRVLVPRSLQKADRIIAVSKNTKTDIIEEFSVPEDKISVVYEGVISHGKSCPNQADFAEVKKRYGISDNYFLFLGTIEPRKNIISLIKAFRNLKLIYDSPAKDYQLIIAGAKGWKDQPVYEAIADANASILGIKRRRSGLERRRGFDVRTDSQKKKMGERRSLDDRRKQDPIKYIGYVPHADKLALLCRAVCFVFPTLYEGFGLPVLEAMSIGTPVITSNLSSLPEIVGSKSGLLIDPTKEAELIDAMQHILTDEGLRESLSISGHERAQEFNWNDCAQKTLEVYQSLKK
ncbi:MAG TPA: glycosyltransferase family 1 protein [bacterium]|nr:glycosyltransferase family 1 protein [bacterium]HPN80962.1 glycosyltransferase family 1 protein [bacterium]HPW39376.1 glycosyltransferase family 1 protein [bacterium]